MCRHKVWLTQALSAPTEHSSTATSDSAILGACEPMGANRPSVSEDLRSGAIVRVERVSPLHRTSRSSGSPDSSRSPASRPGLLRLTCTQHRARAGAQGRTTDGVGRIELSMGWVNPRGRRESSTQSDGSSLPRRLNGLISLNPVIAAGPEPRSSSTHLPPLVYI
jgi:hypothetical protein